MSSSHKFWMPLPGEAFSVTVFDGHRTRALQETSIRDFIDGRVNRDLYTHVHDAPCVFCWAKAEARYREHELAQWADDGGPPE